jgi:hypothetical protein
MHGTNCSPLSHVSDPAWSGWMSVHSLATTWSMLCMLIKLIIARTNVCYCIVWRIEWEPVDVGFCSQKKTKTQKYRCWMHMQQATIHWRVNGVFLILLSECHHVCCVSISLVWSAPLAVSSSTLSGPSSDRHVENTGGKVLDQTSCMLVIGTCFLYFINYVHQ